MVYDFVGLPSYSSACESQLGLLGLSPKDASEELGVKLVTVYKAIKKGRLDLIRVILLDASVVLYVSFDSIRSYKSGSKGRQLSKWQLVQLEVDRLRGFWNPLCF